MLESTPDPDVPTGPLTKMFLDNAEMIDRVISEVGISAVSEFFINVGTGMAANYGLGDQSLDSIPLVDAEEEK